MEVVRQTLNQSRTTLRQVLDDDIPASVSEEPVQRRLVLVLGDVVADLDDAAISPAKQVDLIAGSILEQEPVRSPRVSTGADM